MLSQAKVSVHALADPLDPSLGFREESGGGKVCVPGGSGGRGVALITEYADALLFTKMLHKRTDCAIEQCHELPGFFL